MRHQFTHRVIYQDTDAAGVVYYANYLGLFERGRMELLRQEGISIKELKEKEGVLFAVIKVECNYQSPALLDDEIIIETAIDEITPARIIFDQSVLRGNDLLAAAKITLCAIKTKSFKPTRLPGKVALALKQDKC